MESISAVHASRVIPERFRAKIHHRRAVARGTINSGYRGPAAWPLWAAYACRPGEAPQSTLQSVHGSERHHPRPAPEPAARQSAAVPKRRRNRGAPPFFGCPRSALPDSVAGLRANLRHVRFRPIRTATPKIRPINATVIRVRAGPPTGLSFIVVHPEMANLPDIGRELSKSITPGCQGKRAVELRTEDKLYNAITISYRINPA